MVKMSTLPTYLAAAAGALALCTAAPATLITMSNASSEEDEVGGTQPDVLDALVDINVSGSTLSIMVTNTTVGPDTYNISEFYFNASSAVTGLTPTSIPTGWSFSTDPMDLMVAGFGSFDFALLDGFGAQIMPGDSLTFEFTISGMAGKADFANQFSSGGERDAIVSAKFINGPDDDSAFGAVIPGPGTLALLGVGGLLLRRRRRS